MRSKLVFLAGVLPALCKPPHLPPHCGEGPEQICYGINGGVDQELDLARFIFTVMDVAWDDEYNKKPLPFFTMPPEEDCSEWEIPRPGAINRTDPPPDDNHPDTVLLLAKHIYPWMNSSVLLLDVARTFYSFIGDNDEMRNIEYVCGRHGGQQGVIVNPKNPYYNTPEYLASGAKPEGIMVKVVRKFPKKEEN